MPSTSPTVVLPVLSRIVPRSGRRQVSAGPLEHPHDPSPRFAARVEDVTDVEGHQLVLAQPGPERHRVEHVIPEPGAMFPGDLEQQPLLPLG